MHTFIPQLVTKNSPARSSPVLIPEKALGPGFDFRTLNQQMSHALQGSAIQEVERFLAQGKVQGSNQTVRQQINPETNHASKQTTSSFLEKAWHKLGFSQEEESGDNRLSRLRKRRKKRRSLTM